MAKNTPTKETAPIEPTVTKTETAAPKLQAFVAPANDHGMVTLVGEDGSRTRMTAASAARFTRAGRNPNYSIES